LLLEKNTSVVKTICSLKNDKVRISFPWGVCQVRCPPQPRYGLSAQ